MLAHAVVAPSVDEPAVSLEDPTAITVPRPPANGNLWERIRAGFAMPDLDTPQVKKAADWYAANPEYVARMVEIESSVPLDDAEPAQTREFQWAEVTAP